MSTQSGPSTQPFHRPGPSSQRSENAQFLHPAEYAQGRIPWALQPRPVLCHSEQELKDLHLWRSEVAALISERIAAHETPHTHATTNRICEIDILNSAGRRLAGITELVEQILRYAHPVTRLIALGVYKRWRDIALYVMEQDVCLGALSREPRCAPVRLHDIIPDTFARPSISWNEEFQELVADREGLALERWNHKLVRSRRKNATEDCEIMTIPYLPSRLTQRLKRGPAADAIGARLYDSWNIANLSYIGIKALEESPRRTLNNAYQWIDLSQFEFNPLFTRLFDNHMPTASGIAEITLLPRKLISDETGWRHIPEAYLEHLNMELLTQPPVVSLNISIRVPLFAEDKFCPRKLLHIVHVKNEEGIRVGELLSALKKAYPLAVEHWIYWAKALHAAANNIHWNQDIWIVDGAPKLLISMGGEEHPLSSHYLACIYALPSRDQRQVEWMPESMFKHARLKLVNTEGGTVYIQVLRY